MYRLRDQHNASRRAERRPKFLLYERQHRSLRNGRAKIGAVFIARVSGTSCDVIVFRDATVFRNATVFSVPKLALRARGHLLLLLENQLPIYPQRSYLLLVW